MPIKLLFIVSHYFYRPTVEALARLALPCETTVVPYDDYDHIARVYGQYADRYDACFTSGIVARQAIELVYPDHPGKLVYFQISPNALHRDILRVILDTQSMDLSRIAMDFMVATGNGYSVADFLKMEDISGVYSDNASLVGMVRTGTGYTVENYVFDRICTLWEAKAIDLVICQYSSIVPRLQARGIPFRCSFVSDQHLNTLIQEVLVTLELQRLQNDHPAIVQVFARDNVRLSDGQYRALRHHIQQFIRANLMECVIQDTDSCCVLITSVKILRFLTDDFRSCLLSSWLSERLDLPVLVAYGMGTTVPHAMNNVQLASKEAKLQGSPFIVDSKGNLIGPLNSEKHMVISSANIGDISSIARQCGLSTMTIQKIATILQNLGSDKLTTQDLAAQLHTSVRNANRIMQNLCQGGAATPAYTQASRSRGRPVQVYALNFDRPAKSPK